MEKFYFADLTVDMNCHYPMLTQRSRKYLLPESDKREADITIDITKEDFKKYERALNSDDMNLCEYMLAGECFYRRLLSFDGMLLHSSAVCFENKTFVFSADSGIGKSTHTHLWTKYVKDAFILNDDKPAVRKVDGVYKAYGTPFSGKNDESENCGMPVSAIVFIERSKENKIRKISPIEAVPLIYKQTIKPTVSPKHMDILFRFLDGLLASIPSYILSCDISPEAVKTSFEELTGKRFDEYYRGEEK